MPNVYDVAVIGCGPAGLSAALSAASEGLSTTLLCAQKGGQAGTSSLIENYLGFPQGISGPDLTDRAFDQAEKFGATIHPCTVEAIARNAKGAFVIATHGGDIIRAKAVIVATGAQYNKLPDSTHAQDFEGHGVHYACTAATIQGRDCKDVVVVGGGNSAGQAAMFLSGRCERVHLVVRRDGLRETMSAYLVQRIAEQPNITVHPRTVVRDVEGDGKVESVVLFDLDEAVGARVPVTDLFVMIGAKPNSDFLVGLCQLDDKGFVLAGLDKATSTPGVYAVGDVRSGSVKRVANATGEGAACISALWGFLNPAEDAEAA